MIKQVIFKVADYLIIKKQTFRFDITRKGVLYGKNLKHQTKKTT